MKKIYFFLLSFCFVAMANAQIENPVRWTYTAKKVSDKLYDVYLTATLGPKWHIYAQDAGEGPVPTEIKFGKNPLLNLEGKTKEVGKMEKQYDENFKSVLKFYASTVSFVQRVKVKSAATTVLKGTVTYMVCNDSRCLPPKDVTFTVKVPGK